jgi:S1-C subfamily serine protease
LRQVRVPRKQRKRSLGSGVIVRSVGAIIPTNQVVDHTHEALAVLADRRALRAALVDTDPRTDLTVLCIAGSPFPAPPSVVNRGGNAVGAVLGRHAAW